MSQLERGADAGVVVRATVRLEAADLGVSGIEGGVAAKAIVCG